MDLTIETVTLEAGQGVGLRRKLPMAELSGFFGEAFMRVFAAAGPAAAGPPFAQYYAVDDSGADVEVVVPTRGHIEAPEGMAVVDWPGGEAAQALWVGPYDELHAVYGAIEAWMAEHGRAPGGAPREVYLTSPADNLPPEQYRTLVVWPLA